MTSHRRVLAALLACFAIATATATATAQDTAPGASPAETNPESMPVERSNSDAIHGHDGHRAVFSIDRDAELPAGERAEAVIAIAGSAIAAGDVEAAVVAMFGTAHAAGTVGDAVVALFGDAEVTGTVDGEVVALFGDVHIRSQARVNGDIAAIGGRVLRDPGATVQGDIQEIAFPVSAQVSEALGTWFRNCALLGRPLALAPGLEWAWGLASGFLALYVTLALLFTSGVERCVRTFELQPGQTVLASILAVLLTPLVMVLLAITIVGAPLIPFVWLALLATSLFGKSVVLATLGRRITRFLGGPFNHAAVAVLVGGAIVLALYLVPFLGFLAFTALAMLGTGVVLYTLLLSVRARRDTQTNVAADTPLGHTATPPPAPQPVLEPPTTAAPVRAALPRATFWIRMAALFVDVVLIGVILSVFDHDGDVLLVLLAIYAAAMWKLRGTTIGGILCHLQVVRVDGRELDWATCIVRALSCFLSLAVGALGFFWIAFDKERQAWHDKIAGTVVVRVPHAVSLV